jgi:hypothetical protein
MRNLKKNNEPVLRIKKATQPSPLRDYTQREKPFHGKILLNCPTNCLPQQNKAF